MQKAADLVAQFRQECILGHRCGPIRCHKIYRIETNSIYIVTRYVFGRAKKPGSSQHGRISEVDLRNPKQARERQNKEISAEIEEG
jgi:hypothetical protein